MSKMSTSVTSMLSLATRKARGPSCQTKTEWYDAGPVSSGVRSSPSWSTESGSPAAITSGTGFSGSVTS